MYLFIGTVFWTLASLCLRSRDGGSICRWRCLLDSRTPCVCASIPQGTTPLLVSSLSVLILLFLSDILVVPLPDRRRGGRRPSQQVGVAAHPIGHAVLPL